MFRKHLCVGLGFLLLCLACSTHKYLDIITAQKKRRLSLSELRSNFGTQEIEVNDHYLNRRVRYRALPLAAILRAFAPEPDYDEILFHCADGYEARATRDDFKAGRLDSFYLAYGEGGDRFTSTIMQGKQEVSPEPFYAVSTDANGYATLSWPYEVTAVEFIRFSEKYPGLVPPAMPAMSLAHAGFQLFRKECLRCHSLNLMGGEIGPELNIPRNITEYRGATYLREFIRNPSAFRARSKMPPFPSLTEHELSSLLSYLRVMAKYKKL